MATRPARTRRASPAPAGTGKLRIGSSAVSLALLAIVFALKLAVLLQLHDHPLLQPRGEMDSGIYLDLARGVAAGDLLAGGGVFFVSPLYVYFLAAALALSGGSVLVAGVLQVALGTLAVWLAADTARLWFGPGGAVVAGALTAACGTLTFNEILILQSSLDPFLTALGLWLLARAWQTLRFRTIAAAGVVLGLHALNRPNVAVWAAAAVVLTVLPFGDGQRANPAHGPLKRRAAAAALLAAGFACAVLPAAARNYAAAGEFAPIASHGGLNFYIGNNAEADGTYHLVAGITPSIAGQARDMRRVAERATGRAMSDAQASSWFYGEAWRWIRAHPGAALALFARKLVYVFNAVDLPLNFSYAFYREEAGTLLRWLAAGTWLLLPLGLAGAWLGRRTPGGAWWRWVSFIPVYAVSVAVFFVAGRYRLPLLVACAVTSAGTLLTLWDQWRARRTAALLVSAAAIALLAAGVNANLGLDDGRSAERTELILHEIDSRHDQAATELIAVTVADSPDPAMVLYRAGQAYLERGDVVRALELLEQASRRAPEQSAIHLALGQALLDAGRPEGALLHLRAAVQAHVGGPVVHFDLARALAATGDNQGALAALRAVGSPASLDAASRKAVGRLALELKDPALAEPFLSAAVASGPADGEAREALGLALGLLGRRQEAIIELEAACRLAPASASARLNLAVMYGEDGRTGDARRLAEEALRLRPDYDRARALLAALARR